MIAKDCKSGKVIQNRSETNRAMTNWIFSMRQINFSNTDYLWHNKFCFFKILRKKRFQSLQISLALVFFPCCLDSIQYSLNIFKAKLSVSILINCPNNIIARLDKKIRNSFCRIRKHLSKINTHVALLYKSEE